MNLLNLELMNATEKIAEALMMRGLFVEVKNGVLEFSKCNAKADFRDVQTVLNKLNIPFITHGDNQIEILVNKIPTIKMKKILAVGGRPFTIDYERHHQYWRYFMSRNFGIRVNAFQLEYNMARFVKSANLAGIVTYAGCNGHLKKAPRFQFASPFFGAWFNTIQHSYFQHLQLNYKWEIAYDGITGAELRAKKGQSWCQAKIHEDTLKMAQCLEQHAEEIRNLKGKCFRKCKHKNITSTWVKEKNYTALENWMMSMIRGNTDDFNKRDATRFREGMAI